ncbi:MAG: hypothetical protein IPK82_31780 [Polyangiaceae bacterium]|nr:hypothetical protein [Polyangiaceae bacterium]
MGHKESAAKLLLAVATAGLTTCDNVGAVDPAPEPLNCDALGPGVDLEMTGTFSDPDLALTLQNYNEWGWKDSPTITAEAGFTITNVDNSQLWSIEIAGTFDAGVTETKIIVKGQYSDGDTTCDVSRTFTVTVNNGAVEIARLDFLPLSPQRRASIQMLRRDGLEVELRASGAAAGESVAWTPTAGKIAAADNGKARWHLPKEPGVYQVEMLIDRGDEGFAIDTLTLEVVG